MAENGPDSPQKWVWLKYPRLAILIVGLGGIASLTLNVVTIVEKVRNICQTEGPGNLPPNGLDKDQLLFQAGVRIFSAYFWVERGKAAAGGTDNSGRTFEDGFDRARFTIDTELRDVLRQLGFPDEDVDDLLKPVLVSINAKNRARSHDELGDLYGKLLVEIPNIPGQ